MTLDQICDRLRERLSGWYEREKKSVSEGVSHHLERQAGWISPGKLCEEVDKFFSEFPELSDYRRDIFWNFDVVEGSFQPGCLEGCCIARSRVRGIVVEPICWDRIFRLATGSRRGKMDWKRHFSVGRQLLKHYPMESKNESS